MKYLIIVHNYLLHLNKWSFHLRSHFDTFIPSRGYCIATSHRSLVPYVISFNRISFPSKQQNSWLSQTLLFSTYYKKIRNVPYVNIMTWFFDGVLELLRIVLKHNIIHLSLYTGWGREWSRFYPKWNSISFHNRALH